MNILLSSYDFHEEWAKPIMEPIIDKNMKVTVIPFSFDEKEVKNKEDFDHHYGENGRHTPYIYRPFLYYGIARENIIFVDYFRDSIEIMQEKIKNADILFLTGGLPDQYMKRLKEKKLTDFIVNNHQIIIGASAGAMVQFDTYHVTPDDDYPFYHYQHGLAMVSGFEIEVHYCHSSVQNEGIKRVMAERGLPTYTVANDGGILVDNKGKIIPFGHAYLVNE